MDLEYKFGKMVRSIKATGSIIRRPGKVNSFTPTATNTKANG